MTTSADVTATDGDGATEASAGHSVDVEDTDEGGTLVLTPDGPQRVPDPEPETTAAPEPDPEPSSAHLAATGALAGDSLAEHLGVDGLEAHALTAMEVGGAPDGTEAPAGAVQSDGRHDALLKWLDKPTYHEAFHVGDVKFSTCGLCSVLVGPDHDWHTEQHRRTGE